MFFRSLGQPSPLEGFRFDSTVRASLVFISHLDREARLRRPAFQNDNTYPL